MKNNAILCAVLLAAATTLSAQSTPGGKPLDPQTEKIARQALPVCPGMTLTAVEVAPKFPKGFSALLVRGESPNHFCDGQWVLVTSPGGTYYVGYPWFITDIPGETIEEKLRSFGWNKMQVNITATIERKRSPEGLFPTTLVHTTAAGKVPLEGLVDPDGLVFFQGRFHPVNGDTPKLRMAALLPLIASSPGRGAAKPEVTIVEFSDFQCPACKRTAEVGEAIVARHEEQARYVRFDLPLISNHPWAFAAALAGRAIHRQNPDLFWEYKKQVYQSQDQLNAFTFDDFARGFAEDRGLDMARYDADLGSQALRDELLKGVGAASSNQIQGTPTFMVNGVFVNPGPDGRDLRAYVDALLGGE